MFNCTKIVQTYAVILQTYAFECSGLTCYFK